MSGVGIDLEGSRPFFCGDHRVPYLPVLLVCYAALFCMGILAIVAQKCCATLSRGPACLLGLLVALQLSRLVELSFGKGCGGVTHGKHFCDLVGWLPFNFALTVSILLVCQTANIVRQVKLEFGRPADAPSADARPSGEMLTPRAVERQLRSAAAATQAPAAAAAQPEQQDGAGKDSGRESEMPMLQSSEVPDSTVVTASVSSFQRSWRCVCCSKRRRGALCLVRGRLVHLHPYLLSPCAVLWGMATWVISSILYLSWLIVGGDSETEKQRCQSLADLVLTSRWKSVVFSLVLGVSLLLACAACIRRLWSLPKGAAIAFADGGQWVSRSQSHISHVWTSRGQDEPLPGSSELGAAGASRTPRASHMSSHGLASSYGPASSFGTETRSVLHGGSRTPGNRSPVATGSAVMHADSRGDVRLSRAGETHGSLENLTSSVPGATSWVPEGNNSWFLGRSIEAQPSGNTRQSLPPGPDPQRLRQVQIALRRGLIVLGLWCFAWLFRAGCLMFMLIEAKGTTKIEKAWCMPPHLLCWYLGIAELLPSFVWLTLVMQAAAKASWQVRQGGHLEDQAAEPEDKRADGT